MGSWRRSWLGAAMVGVLFSHVSLAERAALLQRAVAGADRVEVFETRGVLPPGESPKGAEFRGEEAIRELVAGLEFSEEESGPICNCIGNFQLVFFDGERRLARVSYHHSYSLRWEPGSWEGDSVFTKRGIEHWCRWFEARGDDRFAEEHAYRVDREARSVRARAAFAATMPQRAQVIFREADHWAAEQGGDPWGGEEREAMLERDAARFAGLFARKELMAVAALEGLGAYCVHGGNAGEWGADGYDEDLMARVGEALTVEAFARGVENASPAGRCGAAHLYFGDRFRKRVDGKVRGRLDVLLVEAVIGFDESGNWSELSGELPRMQSPEMERLLHRVAKGEVVAAESLENRSLAIVSPRFAAGLCLMLWGKDVGWKTTRDFGREDELRAPDAVALKLCRALAGENEVIDASVFEVYSGLVWTCAIEALARDGRREAVDLLVNHSHGLALPGVREQAEAAVDALTGGRWSEGEGGERIEWGGIGLRKWWEGARASYRKAERSGDEVDVEAFHDDGGEDEAGDGEEG